MSNLINFNFENHEVRTAVKDNGDVYFCLPDVANVLGISRSSDLLQVEKPAFVKNETSSKRGALDPKGVEKIYISYESGKKQVTFINEPNLYRVIFRSNKKEAVKFQDWVFEEVLPTIRKTGSYSTQKTTKSDRKPLVQAVNMLCVKSGLHQKEVWTMVHQYMGVDSIEDIALQDIPKAVEYVHRLICDLSKLDEEQLLYNEMWRQMGIMRQIEVRKELEQLKSEMHQLFERLETATKLNSIIYDAFVQPIRPTLTREQRDIAIQRAIEGLERSRLLLRLI